MEIKGVIPWLCIRIILTCYQIAKEDNFSLWKNSDSKFSNESILPLYKSQELFILIVNDS